MIRRRHLLHVAPFLTVEEPTRILHRILHARADEWVLQPSKPRIYPGGACAAIIRKRATPRCVTT
jgi:hypothetical protein